MPNARSGGMSERLADVRRRIATVHQLGAVVDAMRGIAAARAHQSRALLPAIRAYADTARTAIAQARSLDTEPHQRSIATARSKPGLIIFGAEQGFAGAFAEQVLNEAASNAVADHVFLVGDRAAALARERGWTVAWQISLPSRATALPDMASALVDALYAYLGVAGAVPMTMTMTMVYPIWTAGQGATMARRSLLPLDDRAFAHPVSGEPPLINLPPAELTVSLAQEYVFAQLCEAAAEAFAAENEARMATMAAAKTSIDGKLQTLEREERLTRQEEITAEVVELAAGARAHHRRA
jgi:F-type H+-transporting ATPase subunit gamma